MKLTYPTFASPLLYLLCLASEALAAATMSAGFSSTYSSIGNNQICTKSPPIPSPVGLITPPLARASQPIAHRNPLPLVWCHCCKSCKVIPRVSTTIRNRGRVFYKCQGIPIPAGWCVGQVTEGTTEEQDAEQKVKDVVPLIMAKQ